MKYINKSTINFLLAGGCRFYTQYGTFIIGNGNSASNPSIIATTNLFINDDDLSTNTQPIKVVRFDTLSFNKNKKITRHCMFANIKPLDFERDFEAVSNMLFKIKRITSGVTDTKLEKILIKRYIKVEYASIDYPDYSPEVKFANMVDITAQIVEEVSKS